MYGAQCTLCRTLTAFTAGNMQKYLTALGLGDLVSAGMLSVNILFGQSIQARAHPSLGTATCSSRPSAGPAPAMIGLCHLKSYHDGFVCSPEQCCHAHDWRSIPASRRQHADTLGSR